MTKTRDQLLAVCLLDDSDLPLDRLALLFAVEHQNLPLIAVEQNLDEINRLADALSADDHSISEEHLVQFVFHQEDFKGNAQNYFSAENSYLNRVLERRRGIPITLALVYLSIAERIGLSAEGVSFPGHFLLRFKTAPDGLFDPFSGRTLSASDCQTLLQQTQGPRAQLEPKHTATANRRDLMMRLLENLKQCFWQQRTWSSAELCLDQQRLLKPHQPALNLQLGNIRELRGDLDSAKNIYAQIIESSKDSEIGQLAAQRLMAMGHSRKNIH